jgi:hypothetical protein
LPRSSDLDESARVTAAYGDADGRSGRHPRPDRAFTEWLVAGLPDPAPRRRRLTAEVRCWDKAHAAAERAGNAEALEAIVDRGITAALEYAEVVESPAERGGVLISIWFDQADEGNLRRRVSYERTPE